ncbi:hypothetical protein POX_b02497 [Penicillium oxalicum]|uniref:Uncharacterized protein n=1 Tax=Penicillium oxalicum (strain 114-2 / CGMCC 5302) TaxID=933388 RepID=S7ZPC2_PENO1|nr:hypothetical protein POX_b02497 [Penicillium oxalicum]EPS30496.1 hypothetical protein PDE_05447 [Penicillium oxalicum 114-2]KAI2792459.1 hypothetical protein POX_b02497 [Penicillium oxalicum]
MGGSSSSSSSSPCNGTVCNPQSLNSNNLSQVPKASQNGVNRFARASAADSPYYAGARLSERSKHLNGLSSQVDALDDILKAQK